MFTVNTAFHEVAVYEINYEFFFFHEIPNAYYIEVNAVLNRLQSEPDVCDEHCHATDHFAT